MSERLNKYLALQLGVSRREADSLIEHGQVRIDGTKAILGSRYEPGSQIVVRNQLLGEPVNYEYLALNKPAGYVSSRKQQGDNPTIYALLQKNIIILNRWVVWIRTVVDSYF